MTDQELNEAVARKLGWMKGSDSGVSQVSENSWAKGNYLEGQGYSGGIISGLPAYSTSIEAAWEIVLRVEKMNGSSFRLNGFKEQTSDWELEKPETVYESGKFEASIVIYSPKCDKCGHWKHDYYRAFADSAPKAICLAFLKLK